MGVYVIFLFKSPAPVVKKIEDYFKVFDPVLKFMVVKLGKKQIAALPENLAKNVAGIPVASQETASSEQKAGA